MIDHLYEDTISFKDKSLSILCYIWLFPIFIIFFPHKSKYLKNHLRMGLILSILISLWIGAILIIVKRPFNIKVLNGCNSALFLMMIIVQIVQIMKILKKRN